jgi:hypothetical protein
MRVTDFRHTQRRQVREGRQQHMRVAARSKSRQRRFSISTYNTSSAPRSLIFSFAFQAESVLRARGAPNPPRADRASPLRTAPNEQNRPPRASSPWFQVSPAENAPQKVCSAVRAGADGSRVVLVRSAGFPAKGNLAPDYVGPLQTLYDGFSRARRTRKRAENSDDLYQIVILLKEMDKSWGKISGDDYLVDLSQLLSSE